MASKRRHFGVMTSCTRNNNVITTSYVQWAVTMSFTHLSRIFEAQILKCWMQFWMHNTSSPWKMCIYFLCDIKPSIDGILIYYQDRVAVAFSWCIMTSSNGNNFRLTGPLWGESTGPRWIPLTKASGEEFWCFLCSASDKRLNTQSRRRGFETP